MVSKRSPPNPHLTLYTPIPGSTNVFRLDVDGWMSCAGLEDLDPFLVLVMLLVALGSGLATLLVLVVVLLVLALTALLSFVLAGLAIAAGEVGAEEFWLADLEPGEGAKLQVMLMESLGAGLSGASVCERISSWTMSLRPTL